jgi:hypothetical protein
MTKPMTRKACVVPNVSNDLADRVWVTMNVELFRGVLETLVAEAMRAGFDLVEVEETEDEYGLDEDTYKRVTVPVIRAWFENQGVRDCTKLVKWRISEGWAANYMSSMIRALREQGYVFVRGKP